MSKEISKSRAIKAVGTAKTSNSNNKNIESLIERVINQELDIQKPGLKQKQSAHRIAEKMLRLESELFDKYKKIQPTPKK